MEAPTTSLFSTHDILRHSNVTRPPKSLSQAHQTPTGSSPCLSGASEQALSEGVDSGYSSQVVTPKNGTPDTRSTFLDAIVLPGKVLFARKATKVQVINKPIPLTTKQRFEDLVELFSKPLYDYLISSNRLVATPISIKLKLLGNDTLKPRPFIVVLCDKDLSRKVKQFFNQQIIKSECNPHDQSLPSFEVVVCTKPPRLLADVYVRRFEGVGIGITPKSGTLCGTLVKAGTSIGNANLATIGGLILATKPDGTTSLYGMTAGHIIAQNQPFGQEEAESEINEVDDDGAYIIENLQDYTLEFKDADFDDLESFTSESTDSSIGDSLSVVWSKIGEVRMTSFDKDHGMELDWALVHIEDTDLLRPNLVVMNDVMDVKAPIKHIKGLSFGHLVRHVVMVSRRGLIFGKLEFSPSHLMLKGGGNFAKAYTLLEPSDDLKPGDCGAWIIDGNTGELYGHVIALDCFGEAYVVPIEASLDQMNSSSRELTFSIPTQTDIFDFRMQEMPSKQKSSKAVKDKDLTFHLTNQILSRPGRDPNSDVSGSKNTDPEVPNVGFTSPQAPLIGKDQPEDKIKQSSTLLGEREPIRRRPAFLTSAAEVTSLLPFINQLASEGVQSHAKSIETKFNDGGQPLLPSAERKTSPSPGPDSGYATMNPSPANSPEAWTTRRTHRISTSSLNSEPHLSPQTWKPHSMGVVNELGGDMLLDDENIVGNEWRLRPDRYLEENNNDEDKHLEENGGKPHTLSSVWRSMHRKSLLHRDRDIMALIPGSHRLPLRFFRKKRD